MLSHVSSGVVDKTLDARGISNPASMLQRVYIGGAFHGSLSKVIQEERFIKVKDQTDRWWTVLIDV